MADASSTENAHGMARRARKVFRYAEVHTPRVSDIIVDILTSAGAIANAGTSPSSSGATKQGMHFLSIADLVRERSNTPGGGKQYGAIRQTLIKLLASGRVRRRLVTCAAPTNGDTESALRLLIMSSLQIDPDPQAPWSLEPIEHPPVSPKATPLPGSMRVPDAIAPAAPWMHHNFLGEALVGRSVEVWWDGDAMFHPATVVSYHEAPLGSFGMRGHIGARMHTLLYANGLRTVEDLEGTGEPRLWRLCNLETDETPLAEPSASGGTAEERKTADSDSEWDRIDALETDEEDSRGDDQILKMDTGAKEEASHGPDLGASTDSSRSCLTGATTEPDRSPQSHAHSDMQPTGEVDREKQEQHEQQPDGVESRPCTQVARLENFASLAMLRKLLPACHSDVDRFHAPPGWSQEVTTESRRVKVRWVERSASGERLRAFDRRAQVEDALENEAAAAGSAWLGQIVGGVWEIRQRAVLPALNRVLTGLVATGAVCAVPPQKSGRAHMIYLAANQYFAGEEFPRPSSQKRPREEPVVEPEEELADIELERLRNIQRNQEILRQLGLA